MTKLAGKLIILFTLIGVSLQTQADSSVVLQDLYKTGYEARSEQMALPQRLDLYARIFLAQRSPYVADPLGEGENGKFNQGPLYRFDGFDCTTFVETVMALALAKNSHQFPEMMNRIRYKDGIIAYEKRNHFPSTDWIPNNTKAGFVKDITGLVGGKQTQWSQTWIEKDNWLSMKGVDYKELSRQFGKELGVLPYISKKDLLTRDDLLRKIPSGTIFHIVRPNWNLKKAIGTELDVSHEGFLIWEGSKLYMIHASNGLRDGSNDYKGVKKELLKDYVQRVMLPSSSMAGLNLVQVLDPLK